MFQVVLSDNVLLKLGNSPPHLNLFSKLPLDLWYIPSPGRDHQIKFLLVGKESTPNSRYQTEATQYDLITPTPIQGKKNILIIIRITT